MFLLVISALLATGWAVINRQYVRDWYVVHTTDPQPAAAKLMPQLSLTGTADFLYKASQTNVLGSSQFNSACSSVSREHSIVLGCYTNQRIYVYDVTDPRLSGVQEVTAAHELLHAAYDRMSLAEKNRINKELEQAVSAISDPRLTETLAEYKKTEPGQIDNELHSILGTEYKVLPQGLEQHYSKYFIDRAKIVAFSDTYQKRIKENNAQIRAYDLQRENLKTQISSVEQQIASSESQLNIRQQQLVKLRSSNVSAYNDQVPGFNALVARYNTLVNKATELTKEYNQIVKLRNSLSTDLNDLIKQLDSNYQTR